MRLAVFGQESITIEGDYSINAQMEGFKAVKDSYQLRINFPKEYPRSLPTVIDTENRIPRRPDYHTYDDGSFCLGSEIKLKSILFDAPSVIDFANKILDPFLYAVSYRLKYNVYPFGELDHGESGLIDDYQRLFNVKGKGSVLLGLAALGKRKREANKLLCPCRCGVRLGRCDFRFYLQKFRLLDRKRWFRDHLSDSFTAIEKPKKRKRRTKPCLKNARR